MCQWLKLIVVECLQNKCCFIYIKMTSCSNLPYSTVKVHMKSELNLTNCSIINSKNIRNSALDSMLISVNYAKHM